MSPRRGAFRTITRLPVPRYRPACRPCLAYRVEQFFDFAVVASEFCCSVYHFCFPCVKWLQRLRPFDFLCGRAAPLPQFIFIDKLPQRSRTTHSRAFWVQWAANRSPYMHAKTFALRFIVVRLCWIWLRALRAKKPNKGEIHARPAVP